MYRIFKSLKLILHKSSEIQRLSVKNVSGNLMHTRRTKGIPYHTQKSLDTVSKSVFKFEVSFARNFDFSLNLSSSTNYCKRHSRGLYISVGFSDSWGPWHKHKCNQSQDTTVIVKVLAFHAEITVISNCEIFFVELQPRAWRNIQFLIILLKRKSDLLWMHYCIHAYNTVHVYNVLCG